MRSVKNMERENILMKILGLVEGFIQKVKHLSYFFQGIQQAPKINFVSCFPVQLSLPSDVVSLTFSCEKILKIGVNQFAVLEHLSQLVKDIKSLQVSVFLCVLWVSRFLKV